ncbi:hypothetical protein [Fodinibius salinus]|uniref:hypothetical protein n=1 Tax=Fodinibius salinus TaxID=860790 RepID=UPI001FE8D349|nr:hypothetical protein [Fodinibius salinus]
MGIATVVAINTFSSAADSANVDAVRNDLLSMASTAQGFYMKPDMMGGGSNSFDNTNGSAIGIGDIGCTGDISGTDCVNENGTYSISSTSENSFDITGKPASAGGNIVITVCADDAAISDYAADGSASAPGASECSSSSS